MSLSKEAITRLRDLYGSDACYFASSDCWPYGYDNSKQHHCPDAVVLPTSHQQVVDTVLLCNQQGIPITTRGRGTGTTGAAVPIYAGLVLSMERMNRFLQINSDNRTATVEPGITNGKLQQQIHSDGFFWPPDPGSAAYCTVGGNIACNAAGPRAIKYGTTRENVLSLNIVTGKGDTVRTGTYTTKSAVGYDLTRLIIGSEGTLAIVTQATLKLTPLPKAKATLQASYCSDEAACEAVANVMRNSPTPSVLEFLDHNAVTLIKKHSNVALAAETKAILIAEVDGDPRHLADDTRELEINLRVTGCTNIDSARSADAIKTLWTARKSLSPILRMLAPNKINEDVVVPVSRLPELIRAINAIAQQYQLTVVCFGHAGNGNLHVNILYHQDDATENRNAQLGLSAIFETVLSLDGTLSGEHGVGIAKRDFIAAELGDTAIQLMHAIKRQFDPNDILNPGKTLPLL